jgi:hypothetical protein
MAKARLVALVMYDERMYQGRGHIVYDWGKRIERRFTATAIAEAPMRSGELKAGISGSMTRTGIRQLQTVIRSDAPHSIYVLKGTQGPIMSNRLYRFQGRTGLFLPRGGFVRQGGRAVGIDKEFLKSKGYMLYVRPGAGFGGQHMISVSGQEANNFMGRAAQAVARRHSSLRGFTPGTRFVSYR